MCLPALIPAEGGDKEEFHSWCIQHKRVYRSEAEEGKAFGAYLSNRALVQELNQANRWVSGDVEEERGAVHTEQLHGSLKAQCSLQLAVVAVHAHVQTLTPTGAHHCSSAAVGLGKMTSD